jgi:succinate-semialdehyde dehydrogenase/glutarate-semialdehyde dehydrogenase
MTAGKEELFGPVAAIMAFGEPEEAINLANSTRFGLGSSVFTFNETLIELCKNELQAGNVFINGLMKSHPALPFGGVKASGYGRELGEEGLLAFSNTKSIWEMYVNH